MMHKPFAFFGTPYVARDTLAALAEAGYSPAVVITAPDAPKGRGMQLTPTDTKVWAKEANIPVLTPQKLDADARAAIATYGCLYAIVVAYGKLLPESLIAQFPHGVVNVHYSLLPKYRGASPVEAALLHGDTTTGVAVQRMVKELDAGDILALEEVAIEPTETTRELRPRLITLGANLLISLLPRLEAGTLTGTPQEHTLATHSRKIQKEDGLLSLKGDARTNWNTYRAYAESPGTYFMAEKDGKQMRVKIRTATFDDGLFVPERVVPEGKNEMTYSDFLKGGATPL